MKLLAAALMLALAGEVAAAGIERTVVSHAKGRYTVEAVATLAVPPKAAIAALTDFAHLDRLTPSIRVSRRLRETSEGTLVYTESRACAGWFCRELRKTELVTVRGAEVYAVAIPEQSNVKRSVSRWRFVPDGAGTRLEMRTEVDPAFFVPPLIGPPLVKSAMKREAEAFARGLEQAARAFVSPSPSRPDPSRGG